jgi:hypothetical protein
LLPVVFGSLKVNINPLTLLNRFAASLAGRLPDYMVATMALCLLMIRYGSCEISWPTSWEVLGTLVHRGVLDFEDTLFFGTLGAVLALACLFA